MRLWAAVCKFAIAAGTVLSVGCADTGSGPNTPASIEFDPFPSPAIVVGDTLRNEAGIVTPAHATVRNASGNAITDAPTTYIYADFNRDSALSVNPSTGVIVALKLGNSNEGRIAARVGNSLQVIRSLTFTTRPDTVTGNNPGVLKLSTPDTARKNTSSPLSVTVSHKDSLSLRGVSGWVVRYELVYPANPSNDTTLGAFLVDDRQRPSVIDTTDGNGGAGRSVRVRPSAFAPGGSGSGSGGQDSIVVRVLVRYRGLPVSGSPLRLVVPIQH